jgi:hypothetical protein
MEEDACYRAAYAGVAQLVEHFIRNEGVRGSSPRVGFRARGRRPSTVAGYRALLNSQLLPVFGEKPIESITTPQIEAWIGGIDRAPARRTKALVLMHGIFKRAMEAARSASQSIKDVLVDLDQLAQASLEILVPASSVDTTVDRGMRPGLCVPFGRGLPRKLSLFAIHSADKEYLAPPEGW